MTFVKFVRRNTTNAPVADLALKKMLRVGLSAFVPHEERSDWHLKASGL
jgi:hypothetical protein